MGWPAGLINRWGETDRDYANEEEVIAGEITDKYLCPANIDELTTLVTSAKGGVVYGDEMVTNGDFATDDLTGWTSTLPTTGVNSINASSGSAVFVISTTGGYLHQPVTITKGTSYLFSYTKTPYSTYGAAYVYSGFCETGVYDFTNSSRCQRTDNRTEKETYYYIVKAKGDFDLISFALRSAGTITFDNISLRTVEGYVEPTFPMITLGGLETDTDINIDTSTGIGSKMTWTNSLINNVDCYYHEGWSASSNLKSRITVRKAGTYLVKGSIAIFASNILIEYVGQVYIVVNGTEYSTSSQGFLYAGLDGASLKVFGTVIASADDYIEIYVKKISSRAGGAVMRPLYCYLNITKIQ